MTFELWFQSQAPEISMRSAAAVLALAAEGATVPFIARYRKEQTGALDEVGIQKVIDSKEKWDNVLKRQAFIVDEIERQKKLTPELKDKVMTTFDADLLEDIYLPFKQKRKTKATMAKEAGLEPLADWIWNCGHGTERPQPGQTLELWALTFKNEEKDIKDGDAAIAGAQDILIERLSENQDLRQMVRKKTFDAGAMSTGKGAKAKPASKFETYYEYHEKVQSLLQSQNSHRYLAIRRGWMEEELTLQVGGGANHAQFDAELLSSFESAAGAVKESPGQSVLKKAARLALRAYVMPSIDSEVHKALKDVADESAIKVFAENVRKVLLSSPLGPKAVLGVDPGIRTGCKVAAVTSSGQYIASTVMHLKSEDQRKNAVVLLGEVCKNAQISAIAVGNGTAGRETEVFLRSTLKELGLSIPVVMVSESGASVYSASEVAREEFPDLDVTVRGAISIARRLQDPLAELIKTDPKSIGVGQYQHDVSQHALKKSLDQVVDSCVNHVGVDLNTASYHLLSHVSGIGPSLAKSIVEHRNTKGLFKSRQELLEVSRFSKKAFEQAAGFLRIPNAENPLDNTGVHPERYPALESVASRLGKSVKDLIGSGVALVKKDETLRKEVGEFTFKDIVQDLEKPGRDPRDPFVAFQFREDIHEVKDLKPGMTAPGIVTNVTNFGAFVDIGVHQDGLVHISQLADRYVKDPRGVVSPGDRVQVRVLEVNLEKNQIALSMKSGEVRPPESRPAPGQRAEAKARHGFGGGPRPEPGAGSGPRPSFGGGIGSRPSTPTKPKEAFNNAFAGLAGLRDTLKK
jgi:uncharacterized protein